MKGSLPSSTNRSKEQRLRSSRRKSKPIQSKKLQLWKPNRMVVCSSPKLKEKRIWLSVRCRPKVLKPSTKPNKKPIQKWKRLISKLRLCILRQNQIMRQLSQSLQQCWRRVARNRRMWRVSMSRESMSLSWRRLRCLMNLLLNRRILWWVERQERHYCKICLIWEIRRKRKISEKKMLEYIWNKNWILFIIMK
jgi:hypothetical protein